MREIDHLGLQLEHVHPLRMQLLQGHRLRGQRRHPLQQSTAMQPAGFVIVEHDAFAERIDAGGLDPMGGQELDHRPGVEVDEHPADVKDDVADQADTPADCDVGMGLRSAFPATHPARVEMHEIRARVVSNATPLRRERQVAQCLQRATQQAHVHRTALHVQTVLRDAAPLLMKLCIRRGRTIAGDDLVTRLAARGSGKIAQLDVQSGIHRVLVPGAVVPQQMLQLRQRVRRQPARIQEGDADTLVRVYVLELYPE